MKRIKYNGVLAKAFSLTELLLVVAIISSLAVLSGAAIRGIKGSGTVNRAASELSRTLEYSRAYAMSRNTYVRVAFASVPADATRMTPVTVVLVIYSADGTLNASDTAAMQDLTKWPLASRALSLDSFVINDSLNANAPSTSLDETPSGKNTTGAKISAMSRVVPGISGTALSFQSYVQFSPSGEASVTTTVPSRYIKIAVDKPTEAGKNPFILRLSGANGTVSILRKENML